MLVIACLAAILMATSTPTLGATRQARLVTDINRGGSAASSTPREMTMVATDIYFTADGGAGSCELWRSNTLTGVTQAVKTFSPNCIAGLDPLVKGPTKLTELNGQLIFFADDGVNGLELWRSDGTAAGTQYVKDINPGAASGIPFLNPRYEMARLGGQLYFVADDGQSGAELWKTDGTLAGTALVRDINPGLAGSRPYDLKVINGQLYFGADDGLHGYELWTSDGTPDGTRLIKDISPGPSGSYPLDFTLSNGVIYFIAADPDHGDELWRTDSTAAGTTLVKDILPGPFSGFRRSGPGSQLTDVNGTLFFAAGNTLDLFELTEIELWKSDGSEAGTVLVKSMGPKGATDCCGSQPNGLANLNGVLIFLANPQNLGYLLWRSDGTEAGTVQIGDIHPQYVFNWSLGVDRSFTLHNGFAYFSGSSGQFSGGSGLSGNELWRTDGTLEGTVLIRDINEQYAFASSNPGVIDDLVLAGVVNQMISAGGQLYFAADDGLTGIELWRSDGTSAGTTRIADVNPGIGSSEPAELTRLGSGAIFSASDGNSGRELWASNGTGDGTFMVKDINPGAAGSAPEQFVNMRGHTYFFADDGVHGRDLWQSDGSLQGTSRVKQLGEDSPNRQPHFLTRMGRKLFFRVDDIAFDGSNFKSTLWVSDGTEGGSGPIGNSNGMGGPAYASSLIPVGGLLYFVASDSLDSTFFSYGLWKSDGTVAGTVPVRNFSTADAPAIPFPFGELNGALIFMLQYFDGRQNYSELWRSDGTLRGTKLLKQLRIDSAAFAVVGRQLFFVADDGLSGAELWKTDGTAAGTTLVRDLLPGGQTFGENNEFFFAYTSFPTDLTAVGDTLFFVASDEVQFEGGNGRRWLWKSDGTAAGTLRVRAGEPGQDFVSPGNLTSIGRKLVFSAESGATGRELWLSDGTRRGTGLLADVIPGPASSLPAEFERVGSSLLFTAQLPSIGRELWAVPLWSDAATPGGDDGDDTNEPGRRGRPAEGSIRLRDATVRPRTIDFHDVLRLRRGVPIPAGPAGR